MDYCDDHVCNGQYYILDDDIIQAYRSISATDLTEIDSNKKMLYSFSGTHKDDYSFNNPKNIE